MKALNDFFEKYNFLWVLYFLFVLVSQLLVASRLLSGISGYRIWDLALAFLYIISLYAFVFRKRILTQNIWRGIFLIILFDLPFAFWRTIYGDNPNNMQINCQSFQQFCNIFIINAFIGLAVNALPIYYALLRMSFPAIKIPFTTYPALSIKHNESPSRFWAIPVLGMLVKVIILIPFILFMFVIGIVAFVLQIINYFHILIKGKIWNTAFRFIFWTIALQAKSTAFFLGLTDKYPSFGKEMDDPLLSLDFQPAERSSRLLGAPILGSILRYFLVLPLNTFLSFIYFGAFLGIMIGWIPVLFTGRYPKSIYELASDSIKMQAAVALYGTAMTDKYPSFSMSLNHPVKKFLLLGAALLISFASTKFASSANQFAPTPAATHKSFEAAYKESYINSCSQDGDSAAFCECTYSYLRSKHSTDEITKIGMEYQQTKLMPQAIQDAIGVCSLDNPQDMTSSDSDV